MPKTAPALVSASAPAPAPAPASAVSAPAAPPPAPQSAQAASTGFNWPASGPIFQYFWSGHSGLDISPPYGSPIYASASGKVILADKLSYGYGWYLIIDHGNGYTTLYAHTSQFLVGVGDYVEQGQLIARVGATGLATGPHVHFEIRLNGQPLDPLNFLP